MKKVTRFLALLMAVMMVLTVVGCQGEQPQTSTSGGGTSTEGNGELVGTDLDNIKAGLFDFGGITITYADPYEATGSMERGENAETDRLLDRVEMLKTNWNVNVEFKTIEAGTYWDNMVTAVMGNEAYGDLMFGFPWMTADWIGGGAVRDIAPIIAELGIDLQDGTWSQIVLTDNTIGDRIYGVSRGYDEVFHGLLYNPKMFQAAGLKDPNTLIAEGGKWDFATLRDYANRMTQIDPTTGDTIVYGMAGNSSTLLPAAFVLNNGGSYINFDANGMPTFGLSDDKALSALQYIIDMGYVDQSLTIASWDGAAQALLNGQAGMYMCEEWVIDYVQEYAAENGLEENYALTYFPKGPESDGQWIDTSYGGNSIWVPSTISDAQAKAAVAVYAALYFPQYDKETYAEMRAEELFADEVSVEVYKDIVVNNRARSAGYARMGLNEIVGYLCEDLFYNVGTPQSIVNTYETEILGILQDSAYAQILGEQSAG